MARIEVHGEKVVIRLTTAERWSAFRHRDITLDRSAITSAVITDDPWVWIRGVRSLGTRVPGTLAIGTWRSLTGHDFVLARSGREAVVIDFDITDCEVSDEGGSERGWVGEFDEFSRVVISTVHAPELVRALRLDGSAEAVVTVNTAP